MGQSRWFHCILTTYGAWLPGDPRGFRTRHHREHIEGDYREPPPVGKHAERLRRSERLQKHNAVVIPRRERERLGRACVLYLRERDIETVSLAVGGQHLHVQLKCDEDRVIATLGGIKRKLWYERRARGRAERLWGTGRKIVPIRNRAHQRRVLAYILAHRDAGAWVWCWRDPID